MNLDTVLQRQIRPLPATLQPVLRRSKNKLRMQDPRLWYAPYLPHFIHEGLHEVVVLKVAPETLQFQGRPSDELVHAVRVFRPCRSRVSITATPPNGYNVSGAEHTLRNH